MRFVSIKYARHIFQCLRTEELLRKDICVSGTVSTARTPVRWTQQKQCSNNTSNNNEYCKGLKSSFTYIFWRGMFKQLWIVTICVVIYPPPTSSDTLSPSNSRCIFYNTHHSFTYYIIYFFFFNIDCLLLVSSLITSHLRTWVASLFCHPMSA